MMASPLKSAVLSAIVIVLCSCSTIAEKITTAQNSVAKVSRYRSFYAPSEAMVPTIRPHDLIMVDQSAYDNADPQRGDIVVFTPPIPSSAPFIKRVIAVPGDKLAIRGGTILVNGKRVPLSSKLMHPPYSVTVGKYGLLVDGERLDPSSADVPDRSRWAAADRLPRGCYFLIGDNAMNSEDSHIFGCAELRGTFAAGLRKGDPTKLIGKVTSIIPLSSSTH